MPGDPARSFLDRISYSDRLTLFEAGRRRPMDAGEVLFREGDRAYETLIVMEGSVKVWIAAASGRVVILSVLDRGSVLGELSAIDGSDRSANASALTDGEILVMPSASFWTACAERPTLGLELLRLMAERLRGASRRQLEFGTGDALGRLCSALVELLDRYGTRENGIVHVQIPLSQEELGSWGGLSREAVVKGLKSLRDLGWIETDGRSITVIDEPSLRDRVP